VLPTAEASLQFGANYQRRPSRGEYRVAETHAGAPIASSGLAMRYSGSVITIAAAAIDERPVAAISRER
jgi:hypothetical protein